MELRQYLYLVKHWGWLLIVGLVIGSGGAYFYSSRQPVVYQTSTKIMVQRAPDQYVSDYNTTTELQLAKTYSQLITTEPVMQLVSEKLGFYVSSGQVSVQLEPDSEILVLVVYDSDAEAAALIANSLVDVFITYNESLLSARYATSEESLQTQISQVNDQITTLQNEIGQVSQETLQTQQTTIETRIAELQKEIHTLEGEISAILLTITPQAAIPTALDSTLTTPEPTATLTSSQKAYIAGQLELLDTKQTDLDQKKSMLDLYQQAYTNLLVYGQTNLNGGQGYRQDQLQGTLNLYQQIYNALLNNYEQIRLTRLRSTPNVLKIESATVPGSPIQPQPSRSALMGGAFGLLIMGAIAFMFEYLDDTFKTPEDITRILGVSVIGMIGEMEKNQKSNPNGVYVAQNPRSPIAEAYRTLRTNLDFASVDQPLKTLLVTSAGPSEGKTTTALNLAVVMAQGDRKVTLIDADLRRPAIHRYLKIPNNIGLSNIFRSHGDALNSVTAWGEENPISVVTSGGLPPNPTELLGSVAMSQILEKFKEGSDIVILDSPPFIVADPVVLAAKVDGVMIVIEPGKTKIDSAKAMLEQLNRSGARVIGVVLNPISRRQRYYSGKYQYYTYNYHRGQDYYVRGSSKQQKPTPKAEKAQGEKAV